MSKITDGGLTQLAVPVWQQRASKGSKG